MSRVLAVCIGDGPLSGEIENVGAHKGVTCVVRDIDGSLAPEPEIHVTYEYRLRHLTFGGWTYHILVPDTMTKRQEVIVGSVRALLKLDAVSRRLVQCTKPACELTSTDRVVEF